MSYYRGKFKSVKFLHEKLKEAGIESYTQLSNFRAKWLEKMEKSGRLLCPRGGISMQDRLFTEQQVEEIVKAFLPGGVGHWSYKDATLPDSQQGTN